MPDHGIPELTKLHTVLVQVNNLLADVVGVGDKLDMADVIAHQIVDAITGVQTDATAIRAVTDDLPATLTDGLGPVIADLATLATKIANVQWMLTSSLGLPDVVNHYPNLDLRPLTDGVPTYAPNNGSLYQWLLQLAHAVVPDTDTSHRYLGRTSAHITYALPDCWGVEIAVVGSVPGQSFSAQPDAPIAEYLYRASFGRGDYYTEPVYAHHPKQLLPLQGFQPTNLALELRPGVTIDTWCIMPVGFI